MLEPVALDVVPYDTDGNAGTACTIGVAPWAVRSIRPSGTGSMIDVGGVMFVTEGGVESVASALGGNYLLTTVTLPGDDVTAVTVALSVDHITHVLPFADSGCQVMLGGMPWRCVSSMDVTLRAMHDVLRLYRGRKDAR